MSTKIDAIPKWASAFHVLYSAYTDFLLTRQPPLCRARTTAWYVFTLGKIMDWMVESGVTKPDDITARHIRAYISELAGKGLKDSYIHSHARVIRTFVIFLYNEKYIPERIKFKMPAIKNMKVRCLTAEEIEQLLKVCETPREKAVILVMVDTGLRLTEVCALRWQDIDIFSGLVRVIEGKGGKPRSVVVGIATRRALIALRRELNPQPGEAVFQTRDRGRLQPRGLRAMLERLGKRAGVKVNAHAFRHAFATLSLRAQMNPLHLKGLLGHSTMAMVDRYVHMIDDDLVEAHKAHGPIDNIFKKK